MSASSIAKISDSTFVHFRTAINNKAIKQEQQLIIELVHFIDIKMPKAIPDDE